MRPRATALLAVPFSALLLATTGCGAIPEDWRTPAFMQSDERELDDRLPTVNGEVGDPPEVSFPDIVPPEEQISGVIEKGENKGGELVRSDDILLADIVGYKWTAKGETEQDQSTYETGTPVLLQMGQLSEEITQALIDQPVGSRVAYVFPSTGSSQSASPSPEPGASVSIVDIHERYGKGDVVPGKQSTNGGDGLPTVTDTGHDMPEIEIPESDPPEELETVTLIEGDGPEVTEGQQLVTQYTGVTWNDGEVFDATWQRGGAPSSFPIGVGQVIPGWDQGLVGANVGSRVMLVIPPDLAYGEADESSQASGQPTGTLVFVVDILGAVDSQPEQTAPPSPSAPATPSTDPSEGQDQQE
ncbi:FKBP-type peptidyl-prolyl cis-trans isomerase [Salinactinospora qingdaonensis]|uniref:peptidylprolyl isomerase n=1 Tax=Salinactinospora qingdaonensis TaxID=702744 RepID=A0ABP7F2Y4_9ACTN